MPYQGFEGFIPIERLNDVEVRRHVEGFDGDPLRHLVALAKLGVLDQFISTGQRSS